MARRRPKVRGIFISAPGSGFLYTEGLPSARRSEVEWADPSLEGVADALQVAPSRNCRAWLPSLAATPVSPRALAPRHRRYTADTHRPPRRTAPGSPPPPP